MNDQLAERLCIALEQLALELAERNTQPAPYRGVGPVPAPAPAAAPFAPLGGWVCPTHGTFKVVPAGVSKRTGKPYSAFMACDQPGCDEKPPRDFAPPPQRAQAPQDSGQAPRSVLP